MNVDIPTLLTLVFGPVPISLAVASLAKSVSGGVVKGHFDRAMLELKTESAKEVEHWKTQLEITAEELREKRASVQSREARLRLIVLELSTPALETIQSLARRLDNILEDKLDEALVPDFVPPAGWSMTHEYARASTLYVFARYFALRTRLCERLGNELFKADGERDAFVKQLYDTGDFLSAFPLSALDALGDSSEDAQVFTLQQDAIGAAITVPTHGEPRVMNFTEFLAAQEGAPLVAVLKPLDLFLQKACRLHRVRRRLALFATALKGVRVSCTEVLSSSQ